MIQMTLFPSAAVRTAVFLFFAIALALLPQTVLGQSNSASTLPSTTTSAASSSTSSTSLSPSASPSSCPVCFDCRNQGCLNYGTCGGSGCSCPAGFGGPDCASPLCGSINSLNSQRPIRETGTTCKCDTGFTGPNCNICEADNACQISNNGGLAPVCNKDIKVWKANSVVCNVDTPLLTSIYSKQSIITLMRNRTSGTTLGSLWYDGNQQFMCNISGCTQELVNGQYRWYCPDTQCQCIGSSTFCGGPGTVVDLTNSIKSASGDFAFTCDSANKTTCKADFSFLRSLFKDGLELHSCNFGECALPTDNPDLDSLISKDELSAGEKIGVAMAAFVGAIIVGGLVWAIFDQIRAKKAATPEERRGVTIGFSVGSYSIGTKKLLREVQGTASSGKVYAIMGPSGAGKSTLLDILAGKNKSGVTNGTITVDGVQSTPSALRSVVGYVDQEDLLLPTLTVRETLLFSASLRLPDSMKSEQRLDRVNRIIDDLGLSHVADSRIGGFGNRGISGGEKRRVSIGVELVTDPPVLLLDEPTSGLDSFNALSVVRTLADLARNQGKTIIITIHQPRSDVFSMFDDVLVLSSGSPLYNGPGSDAAGYFRNMGKPCPEGYNIADHLLDLAVGTPLLSSSANSNSMTQRSRKRLWDWKSYHNPVELEPSGDAELGSTNSPESESGGSSTAKKTVDGSSGNSSLQGSSTTGVSYRASFLTQLGVLIQRSGRHLCRSPTLLIGHLVMAVLLGLFVGGVYFNSGNSLGGIQNRFGAILFILSLIGFSGLSGVGSFSTERNLFLRERSNGFYSPMAYYVSRLIVDTIPLRIVPALLMGCISYFMIGFAPGATHFTKFITLLMLFSAEIGFFCFLFTVVISDVGAATLMGAIVILFNMLFSGWLINQGSIVPWLGWIQYLSLFRYVYEALVVNDLSEIQIVDYIAGVTVNIPASVILDKFSFDANSYVRNVLISAGILVFLGVLNGVLVQSFLRERR
ncbi:hypothetical protein DFJ73DRAFT_843020 [Zopfochytrium polystomum]|nr:hypothetical protein DFJ73DRAFT_843020 [Zopfochytrium polystomum]